jgi:hypothetical protein
MTYQIIQNDVIEWAKNYKGKPFHALFADPPYHLTSIHKRFGKAGSAPAKHGKDGAFSRASRGFMGQQWDGEGLDGKGIAFDPETWAALGAHLYPGAFGMAFASSRGWHRLAVAIEDAGFIIHPSIFGWGFLSGMPKATRIDTQIDKAAGVEQEIVGRRPESVISKKWRVTEGREDLPTGLLDIKQPATPLAQAWAGYRYGLQAMKPALEPLVLFSKPGIINSDELHQLLTDTSLLLEDLWTRFADSAEETTRAGAIVHSVLSNVGIITESNGVHTSANGAEKNSSEENPRSKRAAEPTAQMSAKIQKPDSGSSVQIAESLPINSPQPSKDTPSSICTVADNATQIIESNSEPKTASNAVDNLSQAEKATASDIVQPNVDTSPKNAPSSKIPSKTETDTDTRAAILRYNSEKARLDLSTIWLWSIIWDDLCGLMSKSIIAMDEKTITELRTLNYTLRRLTLNSRGIASTKNTSNQLWSYASDVNSHFIGLWTCLKERLHFAQAATPKPQLSPIILFQKPYEGRPIDCIVKTGAGALNIDGCRIATGEEWVGTENGNSQTITVYGNGLNQVSSDSHPLGRWPANLVLSEEGARSLDEQSGEGVSRASYRGLQADIRGDNYNRSDGKKLEDSDSFRGYGDSGGASRMFFQSDWHYEVLEQLANADPLRYEPKVSTAEREAGLDELPERLRHRVNAGGLENEPRFAPALLKNHHPCLKPISLIKYLATLLLPPDTYAPRRICIPFAGSGSEMAGAILAGWDEVIGIEASPEYIPIAEARLRWWSQWPGWGQTDTEKILASLNTGQDQRQLSLFEAVQ